MGRHTYQTVVPFAVKNVTDEIEALDTWLSSDDAAEDKDFNGWAGYYECTEDFGRVSAVKLTKSKHVVYILNEHVYSNVGGVNLSVFAKKRIALEAFCEDFDINRKHIKTTVAVMYTV